MSQVTHPTEEPRVPAHRHAWSALRVVACLVLVTSTAVNGRLVAQGFSDDEKETETIRGLVVNSVTHQPIGRALVYSPDKRFAMMCDDGGHFELKIPRIQTGTGSGDGSGGTMILGSSMGQPRPMGSPNALMAKKPGFLMDENASQVILTSANQNMTIPLVPEAVIVGRVNLPSADGTDRLQVELYRRQIEEGRENWASAGIAQTRANGEFRFADLAAGAYKLFTHEQLDRDPLTFNPGGQLYGYPPVFYPSSNDFVSASTIRVEPGATVNVNLSPIRREYYPVKVGVLNMPQGQGLQIEVWAQGRPGPGFSLGYDQDEQAIVGMLPNGNYTIQVNAYGPVGASGEINIGVHGGGVEGATVSLTPSGSIRVNLKAEFASPDIASQWGSVEEDGKPVSRSQMILRSMQLNLFPVEAFRQGSGVGAKPTGKQNDESALIDNVQPGRYWVKVVTPVGYVAAVTSGGWDLLRNPLAVPLGGTSSPIEITLRDDGASVEGTIENWQGETEGQTINQPGQRLSSVYLVPAAKSAMQPLIAWVNPDGNFSFAQIPPGTYRAVAFDRPPTNLEFTNEESMKKYEGKSQVVEFEAGQKMQMRLQLNSTSE
jgi:hypothetical protein